MINEEKFFFFVRISIFEKFEKNLTSSKEYSLQKKKLGEKNAQMKIIKRRKHTQGLFEE